VAYITNEWGSSRNSSSIHITTEEDGKSLWGRILAEVHY
jgi:hypothetical protein